jgi:hypothetical protein
LSIQFSAANIRSGGLLRQAADCLLSLLVLWAIVKYLLSRRPHDRQPA